MASLSPELLDQWVKEPKHFPVRVKRRRPVRWLKYSGFVLLVAATGCLVSAVPVAEHYAPPKSPWWHFVVLYVLVAALCVVVMKIGKLLWNAGDNRQS